MEEYIEWNNSLNNPQDRITKDKWFSRWSLWTLVFRIRWSSSSGSYDQTSYFICFDIMNFPRSSHLDKGLENPMDRGARPVTTHRVTRSWDTAEVTYHTHTSFFVCKNHLFCKVCSFFWSLPIWKTGVWWVPKGYCAQEIVVLCLLLAHVAYNLLGHKTLIGTWTWTPNSSAECEEVHEKSLPLSFRGVTFMFCPHCLLLT